MTYGRDETVLEAAIRHRLLTYLFAIDDRDFDIVRECFAPDAAFWFDGQPEPTVGQDAIQAYTMAKMGPLPFSEHAMTNLLVTAEGDGALARSYVTVRFVVAADHGAELITRGIRYTDRLVESDGDWFVKERVHKAAWVAQGPEVLGLVEGQTSRERNSPIFYSELHAGSAVGTSE